MYLAVEAPSLFKNVSFTDVNSFPILLANIIQILLFLIAILAVIFTVVAGIKYITSQGDPGRTKSAKDTLAYAIVGVVLSSAAYILVDFLAGQFK